MKKLLLLIALLLQVNYPFAQDAMDSEEESSSKISITGTGYVMLGQIASGHSHQRMDGYLQQFLWQNFYSGRINATSNPTKWFTARIGVEVSSSFPVLKETTIMKDIFKTSQKPVLPLASGIFHFNANNAVFFEIESGLMEYAFNNEVKNLGNYLYRSTSYPFFIRTKLDYIYSNLMGLRAQVGLIDNQLQFGAIINTIIDHPPFFDWDFGLYASYSTPNKLIDAGVGVVFERFASVNDTLTDCINIKGTLGDTSATLRGTKLDARLTFDIKQLFGNNDMFGPNDAKIYLESAILGFEEYDFFSYDDVLEQSLTDTNVIIPPKPSLSNRLPILFGVNLPTFKIMDLLCIELEYCKWPYALDWWGEGTQPSPKPVFPGVSSTRDSTWRIIYKDKDNWKWTVYLKKSISKFDLIAMFANDHILYETFKPESHNYTEQSLRDHTDWHWYVKLQYNL